MSLLARAGGALRLGSLAELGAVVDVTIPPVASGQVEFEPDDEHALNAEARSDGSFWSFP